VFARQLNSWAPLNYLQVRGLVPGLYANARVIRPLGDVPRRDSGLVDRVFSDVESMCAATKGTRLM
jgi:hypothetical protein